MLLTPSIYVAGFSVNADTGDLAYVYANGYDEYTPAVTLQEAIGPVPTLREGNINYTNLYGSDSFSTDSAIGYVDHPIMGGGNSTMYSYERWFRFKFAGSYDHVRTLRFWSWTGAAPLGGWTLRWGTSTTYSRPVNTASSIAVKALPTSDPDTANCGGASPLTGPGTNYSDWIVLQASVDLSVVTDPGPALGYASGIPIAVPLYLAWVQQLT